jgi:hypothetical protein
MQQRGGTFFAQAHQRYFTNEFPVRNKFPFLYLYTLAGVFFPTRRSGGDCVRCCENSSVPEMAKLEREKPSSSLSFPLLFVCGEEPSAFQRKIYNRK